MGLYTFIQFLGVVKSKDLGAIKSKYFSAISLFDVGMVNLCLCVFQERMELVQARCP